MPGNRGESDYLQIGSNINRLKPELREMKKELLNKTRRLDSILAEGCQKTKVVLPDATMRVSNTMKFTGGNL